MIDELFLAFQSHLRRRHVPRIRRGNGAISIRGETYLWGALELAESLHSHIEYHICGSDLQ